MIRIWMSYIQYIKRRKCKSKLKWIHKTQSAMYPCMYMWFPIQRNSFSYVLFAGFTLYPMHRTTFCNQSESRILFCVDEAKSCLLIGCSVSYDRIQQLIRRNSFSHVPLSGTCGCGINASRYSDRSK